MTCINEGTCEAREMIRFGMDLPAEEVVGSAG
jgi:hypothetical protein